MELRQGDLFRHLNREFVRQITEVAEHLSCKQGDVLFKVGDPANYFYVLLRGVVTMERGRGRWYTARQPGELFGWSSLIHRTEYAASAVCDMDTEVLKIERDAFLKLLETSQQDKASMYERLSGMLGNQLLNVYMNTAS